MLFLKKVHTKNCPYKPKGTKWERCKCSYHYDGYIKGKRVKRKSLRTADRDRARQRLKEIEEKLEGGRVAKPLNDAVNAFFSDRGTIEASTIKRYARAIDPFVEFAIDRGCRNVEDITVELVGQYRANRRTMTGAKPAESTWKIDRQILCSFGNFCLERKWIEEKPFHARSLKPRDVKPQRERVPFTTDEIIRIRAAALKFGRSDYERKRAYAMLMLLRYYGLRISDVALFPRDRITGSSVMVKQQKTGKYVPIALYPEVREALAAVPVPRGTIGESKFYFWSGEGSIENQIEKTRKTMRTVFQKSGVPDSYPHRFRHTVVNELLAKGWQFERIAVLLGDDDQTIRRYYAHLTVARTEDLFQGLHASMGTQWAREGFGGITPLESRDRLVAGVGFEPTTFGL